MHDPTFDGAECIVGAVRKVGLKVLPLEGVGCTLGGFFYVVDGVFEVLWWDVDFLGQFI